MTSNVTSEDIEQVLKHFSGSTYKALNCDAFYTEVMEKCVELVKLDYNYFIIGNSQGELSAHYPTQIIILENELQNPCCNIRNTDTIYETSYEKRNLREAIIKGRPARCRARFPVPVMLYKGKPICRSATIAGGPEVYTRSSYDYFFHPKKNDQQQQSKQHDEQFGEVAEEHTNSTTIDNESSDGSEEPELLVFHEDQLDEQVEQHEMLMEDGSSRMIYEPTTGGGVAANLLVLHDAQLDEHHVGMSEEHSVSSKPVVELTEESVDAKLLQLHDVQLDGEHVGVQEENCINSKKVIELMEGNLDAKLLHLDDAQFDEQYIKRYEVVNEHIRSKPVDDLSTGSAKAKLLILHDAQLDELHMADKQHINSKIVVEGSVTTCEQQVGVSEEHHVNSKMTNELAQESAEAGLLILHDVELDKQYGQVPEKHVNSVAVESIRKSEEEELLLLQDEHGEVPEEHANSDTGDNESTEGSEEAELLVPEDISQTSDLGLFENVRQADISLLKTINVSTIIDLMVEKKKVKFGVYVTSSEKVDKEKRYRDFSLISLPYPGCEFFLQYRENDYTAKGLVFDWSQSYVDADLKVPADVAAHLKIDWSLYKTWDLVTLTQNYMRILLRLLNDTTSGLLVHCISGWDRTPLFISLLRVSLWADGVVHNQLSPIEILYFTLVYDWMLFGHNLENRLEKGEEILHFCFHMLKFLVDDEFSILSINRKSKHNTSGGGSSSSNGSGRDNVSVTNSNNSSLSYMQVSPLVSRTDSDTQLEGVLLHEDPNGSNVSLNSTCSSTSNRDLDNQSTPAVRVESDETLNGNSVLETCSPSLQRHTSQQRRTSPIAVPPNNRRQRQRADSVSSLTTGGSWQMVTGCGSLRSDTNDSSTSDSSSNRCLDNSDASSTCTLTDDSEQCVSINIRKTRLNEVRKIFGTHYGVAVGLKMKDTPDSHLKTIVSSIAGSVGLNLK